MNIDQNIRGFEGRPEGLNARCGFLEPFKGVVLTRKGIVYEIVTLLVQARETQRELIVDTETNRTFKFSCVPLAIRDAAIAVQVFAGFHAIKLDDTAGRVATEQSALRAAQNFDAFDVKDRIPLQDRVLIRHIIIDQ